MKKWLFLCFALIMGIHYTNSYAHACSCENIDNLTPAEALVQYDAIFTGEVLDLEFETYYDYVAVIKVEEAWVGVTQPTTYVHSTTFRTKCGFSFKKNGRYLIYANRAKHTHLAVSLCSLTKPITEAHSDLRQLGPPTIYYNDP